MKKLSPEAQQQLQKHLKKVVQILYQHIRSVETGKGEWRDYKAVRLHKSSCERFFQRPEQLQNWSEPQSLSLIFNCRGDSHDGVWKIAKNFGGAKVLIKREILDW